MTFSRRLTPADEATLEALDFVVALQRQADANGEPPPRGVLIIADIAPHRVPSPSRRRLPPILPAAWIALREEAVATTAKALAKRRSRDHLLVLLAAYLHMGPQEISRLNLNQVRQREGRIYLKGKLVRRKAVAEALWSYRARDRWWPGEPMFRLPGQAKRMGAAAIRKLVEGYVERAQRRLAREHNGAP